MATAETDDLKILLGILQIVFGLKVIYVQLSAHTVSLKQHMRLSK